MNVQRFPAIAPLDQDVLSVKASSVFLKNSSPLPVIWLTSTTYLYITGCCARLCSWGRGICTSSRKSWLNGRHHWFLPKLFSVNSFIWDMEKAFQHSESRLALNKFGWISSQKSCGRRIVAVCVWFGTVVCVSIQLKYFFESSCVASLTHEIHLQRIAETCLPLHAKGVS